MRWQRVILFAAIVVAHVLAVLFFPAGSVPHDSPEPELSFATLMAPEPTERKTSESEQQRQAAGTTLRRPAEMMRATREAETFHTNQDVAFKDIQPDAAPNVAPSIDWAREAQIAADYRVKQDVETARRAAAFSRWRSQVTPSSDVPKAAQFRWNYARTHRLESSALGLNINLNDRCSLLISLYMMAIIGGCKIGELPVHGYLFLHMNDDPESSTQADR
jgi:hypothetical protein